MTTCLRKSVVIALAVVSAWLPSSPEAQAAAKKLVRISTSTSMTLMRIGVTVQLGMRARAARLTVG